MKKLLSLALMLVGLTTFGQSHKNNTFTTNPYPATISFPSFDTNSVVLSGFSVAALNGTYVWSASPSSARYVKAANSFAIYFDGGFALLTNATGDIQVFATMPEPAIFNFGYFFPHVWEDGEAGGTMGVGNWLAVTRSATLIAVTNAAEFFKVRTLLASNVNIGNNVLTNLSPLAGANGNMLGAGVSGDLNTVDADSAFIAGGVRSRASQRQSFIGGGNDTIIEPKSPGVSADSGAVGVEGGYINADASFMGGALQSTNTSHRNTAVVGSWKSTLWGGPNNSDPRGFGSAMIGVYESLAILEHGSFVGGKHSTNIANGHSVFSFGEGNQLSNVNHVKVLGDFNQATIANNHGGWALGNGHRIDKVARGYLGNTNSVFIDPDGSVTLYSITNRGALGTLGHEWIATNNVPNEPAADGSIATVSSGANTGGALYQRVNGAWAPITNYFSMISGGGPSSTDMIEPLAVNGVSAFLGVTDAKNLYISTGTGAIELNRNNVARISIGAITAISGDLSLGSAGSAISVSGISTIGAVNLGTTPTPYMILNNQTAAAAGAQQVSPGLVLSGNGWKTDATAASQPVAFKIHTLPVQGAASPSANWILQSSINGGAYSDRMVVTSAGQVTAGNYFGVSGSDLTVRAPSGNSLLLDGAGGGTGKTVGWNGSKLTLGNGSVNLNAAVGGVLKTDTTATGNVGGGEDNLITYAIPANALPNNACYIEFEMWGSFAANVNTKQLKIVYGATTLLDTTGLVFNGISWRAKGVVVRTGAATQTATCELTVSGTLLGAVTTSTAVTTAPTETLSGAVTIKATGTVSGAGTDDNSIVQNGLIVKFYPNGN